jgi:hypothetical protein
LGDFRNRGAMGVDGDSSELKIPSFQCRSDPKAYLEREKKVDWIFDCHDYSEQKR